MNQELIKRLTNNEVLIRWDPEIDRIEDLRIIINRYMPSNSLPVGTSVPAYYYKNKTNGTWGCNLDKKTASKNCSNFSNSDLGSFPLADFLTYDPVSCEVSNYSIF